MTKVGVCLPQNDMVHSDFALSLAALARYTPTLVQMGFWTGRSSIVAVARNLAVQAALDAGMEWVLFLDSDLKFPDDTLTRLLSHRKDIVGAIYRRRSAPFEPMGVVLAENEAAQSDGDDGKLAVSGLVEMNVIPTGVLLIRSEVLRTIGKPYFKFDRQGEKIIGEDTLFCIEARAAGYSVWMDTDLSHEIGHIRQQTIWMDTDLSNDR